MLRLLEDVPRRLRFWALAKEPEVEVAVEIRTEELGDPKPLRALLETLSLPHGEVTVAAPINTNASQGYGETMVSEDDIACYRRFVARLPAEIHERIPYLQGYDPEHWATA